MTEHKPVRRRAVSESLGFEASAGGILQLILSRRAVTRNQIAQQTGLSRSTVSQRLDVLFRAGLIIESEDTQPSGGRPKALLRFNHAAGYAICVDVGEERTRIALTDLGSKIVDERVEILNVGDGPDAMLDKIIQSVDGLIDDSKVKRNKIVGLGLGLPAPVDYDAGQVRGWSVMSGWDGYDIRSKLAAPFSCPILIDNDVNLLTLADHRRNWPAVRHLLYVKVGTGIGAGMIIDGQISRGAQGAAGDIGHAHVPGFGDPLCRCGKPGCLEAHAGGWALARDLADTGKGNSHDARDVVELIKQGDSAALAGLRRAGRILGEALAFATSLLNPEVILVGGALSATGDDLVAGIRATIYQHSLPLATHDLRILPTTFRSRAGIAGAAYLVRDHVLAPAAIDRSLSTRTEAFSA